jgi:hypothetical protein
LLTRLFERGSESPAGTQFGRATAHIHGIGRRWRNSLELSRDAFV